VPLIAKELRIERDTFPFRLPKELATQIGLYARFLDSSRDYVVTRIIEYVIGRDREFAVWLREHGGDAAQAPASTDGVRRHAGRPRTAPVTQEADHVPAHR
jgi:hypothetical protein